MPKPHKGEAKDDFISRCMANPEARRDHPKQNERAGFCYGMWKQHAKDADQLWCAYSAEKFVVTNDGVFEGRALTWGEPDDNFGFTFDPDVFNESIDESGVRGVKMLFSHDSNEPIGVWLELRATAEGLFVKGKLALETEKAREIKALMDDGALDGLSVGFLIQEQQDDTHILKAELLEISVCAFPADRTATLGVGDALRHYTSNAELPKVVRNVLPAQAQTLWRKAFNKFSAGHPDAPVTRASAIAWQAVRKVFAAPAREAGMWVQKIKHDGDEFSGHFSDTVILDGVHRSADGYLAANARVARTGIQSYRGKDCGRPEIDVVRVYRPESEVFDAAALKSFAHRPVTVDHPDELVNADNWKDFAVGQTGDKVEFGNGFVRVPLVLMDAAAIKAVEQGKRELSMGYTCELDWTPGKTDDGEEYDATQKSIRGNHLAIVAKARGGSDLRIGDDEGKEREMADAMKMIDVEVDGLNVQVADASAGYLKKALASLGERIATLSKKLADDEEKAKEDKDKAKGEYDAAMAAKDAEITTLKSELCKAVPDAKALDAMVKDRADLIGKARAIFGDALTVDGVGNADIRKQVVLAKVGDAAKAWSDGEIAASFNTLVAGASKTAQFASAIADASGTPDERTKAYDDYDARTANAWRRKVA